MVTEHTTGASIPTTDPKAIRAFWQTVTHPGDVREVRVLDTRKTGPNKFFGVQGGYFDNEDDFVAAVGKIGPLDAAGVYLSLNSVDPALMARAANRIAPLKTAAGDAHVTRRHNLLIDVDPVRPSGISATDDERWQAIGVRDAVRSYLDDLGCPAPAVIAETGNGAALIYALDLPNDEASQALAEAALRSLAYLFSTPTGSIDTAVSNPSRGTRVVGTVNAKGDQVADRLWRPVTGNFAAARVPIPVEVLALLGQQGGHDPAVLSAQPASSRADAPEPEQTCRRVEEGLNARGIGFREKSAPYAYRVYALGGCLTSNEHTDGAAIIVFPNGAVTYRCHHNRCQSKGWADVRDALGFRPVSATVSPTSPNGVSDRQGVAPGSRSLVREADLPEVPPFPTQVLPPIVRRYVSEAATAIGVPDDLVAVPLLTGATACMGSTASIVLKEGFVQWPILWAAIVALPGSAKTPGQDAGTWPVRELQHEAWLRYQQVREADPEASPTLEHFFTTDATKEGLARICHDSPGVLLERDEFGAWVNGFDAYRGGRGGDRQDWLSFWSGKGIKVDRKRDDPIFVQHPAISVVGGIQPDMLGMLRNEAGRDGFIDRILFSYPDVSPATWSDREISRDAFTDVLNLFRHLRRLDGHAAVHLSPEAKRLWVAWFNDNARLIDAAPPGIGGMYAKLPNQVARLALVLHGLTHPDDPRRPLSTEVMDGAIELGEYFRAHAHRVHAKLGLEAPTPIVRLEARVTSALARESNWAARRRLYALLGGHVPAADLTEALESLKQQGIVECRMVATASKPAEEWRVIPQSEGTDRKRANEQSEQFPWDIDAVGESSESSYARDEGAADPEPGADSQAEYF